MAVRRAQLLEEHDRLGERAESVHRSVRHVGNGLGNGADHDADLLSGDESDSQDSWQIPARQ